MINRGRKVGKGLALAEPVQALRTFSRDPWARASARLADGRWLTAVEIQSVYLEECEQALQAGILPDWVGEAIDHWRETLAELERDPLRLADRLDPYCKLLIYQRELERAGFEWEELRDALTRLHDLHSCYDGNVAGAVLRDSDAGLNEEERTLFTQARQDAELEEKGMRERLLFATRLQMLDFHYHELGGLYDRLHDTGRMRDLIATPAEIELASRMPPTGGRAALRGAWIREHRESDWRGDWQYVWQVSSGRCLDLRDPFNGVEREVRLSLPSDTTAWHVDVLELLEEVSGVSA
jgi:hypothetical protein